MMQCNRCHDTNGPFIVDIDKGKCLCEICYQFDAAVKEVVDYIKMKHGTRKIDPTDAVAYAESIESAVFDELGLR